jgi:hypothetical protein
MNECEQSKLHDLKDDWRTLDVPTRTLLETIYIADCEESSDSPWCRPELFLGKVRRYDDVYRLLRVKGLRKGSTYDFREIKYALKKRRRPFPAYIEKLSLHPEGESESEYGLMQLSILLKTAGPHPPGGHPLTLVEKFWRGLVRRQSATLLYCVNIFRRTGLDKQTLRSEHLANRDSDCLDWLSGVGEIHAVHYLTRVLTKIDCAIDVYPFHQAGRAKPGSPQIWLGSPLVVDIIPDELIRGTHFEFENTPKTGTPGPETAVLEWRGNKHAGAHGPKLRHTNNGHSSGEDFAVVVVSTDPRNDGGVPYVLAAGLTPFGTAGAAMCLTTDASYLETIRTRLGTQNEVNAFETGDFEAFLRVKVKNSLVDKIDILDVLPLVRSEDEH